VIDGRLAEFAAKELSAVRKQHPYVYEMQKTVGFLPVHKGSSASSQGKTYVTIRILVADDFGPWRHFVSTILQKQPGWQVVSEASDGPEAVESAEEVAPDLIVLDIGLPKLDGIQAARQIRTLTPSSKILFLSGYESVKVVEEALSTGASGYVVKLDAESELVRAVETIFQGKRFVSSRLKGIISVDPDNTQVSDCPTHGCANPKEISEFDGH
jgi:DNA-binding NarL/FixJ family response regulator